VTSTSKEPAKIAGMFDAIARRYDALNHLLSAGLDRRWRRRTIDALGLTGRERVLDMCTGTGDLAIEAAAHAREVVGIDFSTEMLRIAARKTAGRIGTSPILLARGDATAMPVSSGAFDAATIAFGIRNVLDPEQACREFRRVLVPGGQLAVLEFGAPRLPLIRGLYLWYFRRVLPLIGRFVSKHTDAYSYLPASVTEFPDGDAFADILRRAGLVDVSYRTLSFGIVYLYRARTPSA
jgi:demethylmenaquinone methyltransferase/2-methoxy-6-polyprenyl-1,4-benzoquinol methylase